MWRSWTNIWRCLAVSHKSDKIGKLYASLYHFEIDEIQLIVDISLSNFKNV